MHRGFTTNLSLAGMLLFLLTTLSSTHSRNNAGVLTFYNERGDTIFSMASSTASKSYVIKTVKTSDEIFPLTDRDSLWKIALVKSISPETAIEVEQLIKEQRIHEKMVWDNVVPILDKSIFYKMRKVIRDSGNGGADSINNKEYGGLVDSLNRITGVDSGKAGKLCKVNSVAVSLLPQGKAEFHSHPSGCQGNLAPWPCADAKLSKRPRGCGHTQGPSLKDQGEVKGRTGYVFAMRARIIFIYDSTGVIATLPFSFLDEKTNISAPYR